MIYWGCIIALLIIPRVMSFALLPNLKRPQPILYCSSAPPPAALLAVDLGLKYTGFAVFNATGSLLQFFSREFSPAAADLRPQVVALLAELLANGTSVTHYALEGDALLSDAWEAAIASFYPLAAVWRVAPSEWRSMVLLKKEAQSSAKAKAAARLVSRQIIYRAGLVDGYVEEPMDTDAAEAILLGYYTTRVKLGWAADAARPYQPTLVDRYTNGNVVLPPKKGASRGGGGKGGIGGGGRRGGGM